MTSTPILGKILVVFYLHTYFSTRATKTQAKIFIFMLKNYKNYIVIFAKVFRPFLCILTYMHFNILEVSN